MYSPIEIDDLKEAFIHNSNNCECIYYLDTTTGKIVIDNGYGDPMDIDGNFLYLDGYSIEEFVDNNRFIRLSSNDNCHDYRDMQVFINEIESIWLRNKLENIVYTYKVFQRFKDIVEGEAEKYGWFDFRSKQLEKRILQWLDSQGIEVIN